MLRLIRDKERRNFLAGFAGGYSTVAFVSFFTLTRYWNSISPSAPVVERGNAYAHNEHGWITYFTAFQATSSALLFWSGMAAVMICTGIAPRKDVSVTRWRGIKLGVGWKNDDPQGRMSRGAVAGGASGILAIFLLGPLAVRWLNEIGVVLSI